MTALVAALKQARRRDLGRQPPPNKWVVAEGVRDFGIPEERILAAEVRVTGGLITSEILDVPTDEGKAVTLRRVGIMRPDAAFANSIHDLAMLQAARNPFPVNPSPELLELRQKTAGATSSLRLL